MQVNAKVSFVRITPIKMGFIAREVRGKKVNEALAFLRFCPRKRVATVLSKLIRSAVANADQKGTIDVDNLVVKTLLVGKGPTLKTVATRLRGQKRRKASASFTFLPRTSRAMNPILIGVIRTKLTLAFTCIKYPQIT
jgi:large subunit ribosomal protein L22